MSETQVSVVNGDGKVRALEDIEADVLAIAINHCGGSLAKVARELGMGRSTLYRQIARHKLVVRRVTQVQVVRP